MDKRRYKLAIKSKEKVAADQFSNNLNDALVNKDMDAFWNSWKSKFVKQQRAKVIDGCYDEKSIADDFVKVFSEVCVAYLTPMKDTVSFGLIFMTSSAVIQRPV